MFQRVFSRLKQGLKKTRDAFASGLKALVRIGRRVDESFLEELEEAMITADMGVQTTQELLEHLREAYMDREIEDPKAFLGYISNYLEQHLRRGGNELITAPSGPTVILVCGVNGCGKTTSIAKLAYHFHRVENRKVLLAASDTFRAAAVEQLDVWAQRIGCDIVKHKSGADPGAVAYDACAAAKARGSEVMIVDTAGRLHTQTGLMKELEKIRRVLAKQIEGAPHETLLVLDATTGQNALAQVDLFHQSVPLSGLFLSKLDGTAKGGVVISINRQFEIPVKFIGLGESYEDIQPFSPDDFVHAIFGQDVA
ncbi:MAG: signal recognition particle-docking protein FtsY [Planctomycetota bacterium]|nr:signal recognition particle-docking protein FtsY [Planctomycetota bacterium]